MSGCSAINQRAARRGEDGASHGSLTHALLNPICSERCTTQGRSPAFNPGHIDFGSHHSFSPPALALPGVDVTHGSRQTVVAVAVVSRTSGGKIPSRCPDLPELAVAPATLRSC